MSAQFCYKQIQHMTSNLPNFQIPLNNGPKQLRQSSIDNFSLTIGLWGM